MTLLIGNGNKGVILTTSGDTAGSQVYQAGAHETDRNPDDMAG
ncbi:hypothetical protein [Methanocalculus taiwanensis]|nr:hypothetical protein [Methanocalculus taiwanensis]